MDQRVSLMTLGVADLAVARRFYEARGWRKTKDYEREFVGQLRAFVYYEK